MNDLVKRLRSHARDLRSCGFDVKAPLLEEAATQIEAQEATLEECAEALGWCSGANDFQTDGMAHEGWEKLIRPLIAKLRALRFPGVVRVPRDNDEFLQRRERSLRPPGEPE